MSIENIIISEDKISSSWTYQHEKILAEWADKAMCYRWLHTRSESKYSFLTKLFTIPVIIISTLTGTANFAISRIPTEYQSYAQISIGSLNILAGIISTIQQFLQINELNESHRVASISWSKFNRNIKTELLKNPKERCDVDYIIKASKEEFDRLIETSPSIDKSIIQQFNKEIKKTNDKIFTPEICGQLQPTIHSIFKHDEDSLEKNEANKLISIIKQKQELINKNIEIEDFIKQFKIEYLREPTINEIYENLEDKVEQKIIENFISKFKKK